MSIGIRPREFPNALTTMLASQEGMNTAVSLQGDDVLALVDILDQVGREIIIGAPFDHIGQAFEAPNMQIDLRRKSVRTLRRVCGSQTILPRSCILSENISKEGDTPFASGGFTDVWKGRHNGNRVCIKTLPAYTAENPSKIKQVRSSGFMRSVRLSRLAVAFVPRNRDLEAPLSPERPARAGCLPEIVPIMHHH